MEALEFSSTGEAVAISVIAAVFAVLGPWSAWLHWHGRIAWFTRLEAPPFWIFSDRFWRGLLRAGTVNGLGFSLLFALAAIQALFAEPGLISTGLVDAVPLIVTLFGVVGLSTFALDATLWLLARPRALIPPHLRHLPGAIAERRGASWSAAPDAT
jgi:hypothetical protein